ncbi:MAG: CarD family transcriptional regulator [Lachnospira sp.]
MFEIGDKVLYGVVGVCTIENIDIPPIKGIDKRYYFLQPVYDSKGIIYSPVDSNKVMMRYVISEDECRKIYDRAKYCKKDEELNKPVSQIQYDEMIKSQDIIQLMHLVRVLYNVKNERAKDLRKMKSTDARMLTAAKKLLYGEIAAVMNRDIAEVSEEMDSFLSV